MSSITFIAGGSKGLGQALCEQFQQANHQVFEFSRSGSGPHHIDCDFSQPEQASQIFQQCFDQQKEANPQQVNLIINTAILAPFGGLAQAEAKQIKQHLAINIESTVALIQAFAASFQDSPANKTLAYISSGAARRAIAGLGLYSASKAFFERLVDTMAEEQRAQPQPIDCLVINPGVMNTGMQAEIRSQSEADFPMLPWWQSLYEQGQLADPDDIARICFDLITTSGENGGYYTAQQYLQQT